MDLLTEMRDEANGWTHSHFNDNAPFWQECVACVLHAFSLGIDTFQVYDMIPWLFARLDEPGVRDRVKIQFRSVPSSKHDRVSLKMLDDGNEMAVHIDNMNPDGTGMHPDLAIEVAVLDSRCLCLELVWQCFKLVGWLFCGRTW